MNGQNNPVMPAPDFDKMVWKCPCCKLDRTDRYIKVYTHDVSALYDQPTGSVIINCKYCVDVPSCLQKASSRDWVIKTFIPNRAEKK